MVQCLIASIANIGAILVVTIMFVFLFAVMGVQLFKGAFFTCNDPADGIVFNEAACVGTFTGINETDGQPVSFCGFCPC